MATTESSTGPTPDAAEGTGIRMSLGELPGLADVENPFPEQARATRGGANIYGACSLETFADVGGLSFTHEDAGGFLDYVRQFTAPNFWFQDGSVSIWEYTEPYDDWQDTYGMDAVKVFYHSGHGGMDANGVFSAPLGAAWAGGDTWVNSTQMLLGNERLRYLFWSTCSSLRVLDGQSPILTWANANRGLRMLFGFETTSVDDGTYGQRFWSHWRGGESFSTAWLNASWDISSNQAPSAAACGASAAEAQDRLYNERLFSADPASTAYYSWRWYYSREARAARTQAP